MYALKNENLEVAVLDPVADQERFGTRYCTGGYVFQVTDAGRGPLLSGPTYPDSFNWFDGQGLPEAFNLGPLLDPNAGSLALIIGIGLCDPRENQVREFCRWEVEQQAAVLRFVTQQDMGGYALELERTVALYQRTVRSRTHLRNTGKRPIRLCWFPHPFFPQPDADELCRINLPVCFPENPGYALSDNGFICRKGWPWEEGYYQALECDSNAPLVVVQKHPKLGLVAATCSYAPTFYPIWGNGNTFSWEPFLERTLAGGQEADWWIDYDF